MPFWITDFATVMLWKDCVQTSNLKKKKNPILNLNNSCPNSSLNHHSAYTSPGHQPYPIFMGLVSQVLFRYLLEVF